MENRDRPPNDRRADRRLRQRRRRLDRRPGDPRSAAERVDPVRRRHGSFALRAEADRRGARVRARGARRPRRTGCEGTRDRLQHRQRRDAARCPGAVRGGLGHPGGRGDPARGPRCRARHSKRPRRGDRHGGNDPEPRLRRRVRRRIRTRAVHAGLPALRRVRRGGCHERRRAVRRRRGVPRAPARRRHRHARSRLHPLPADVRRDPVRGGPGCPARLERGGDRVRRLPHPGVARTRASRDDPAASTASSRPATTSGAFRALAHRFLGPEVRHVEAFPTGAIPVTTSTERTHP